MISIAYTSTAVELMEAGGLQQILHEARERNEKHGVTGMLLYRDGTFLQVLEGEEEDVTRIYDLIKGDERHRGLIKVLQEDIGERSFEDWRMGFREIEDEDLERAPGYTQFMENGFQGEELGKNPSDALRMLRHFRHE